MRIGTWNLAGRWSDRHQEALVSADCKVWLLTEVSDRLTLPGYRGHVTTADMRPKVRWAGVFSRLDVEPLPDPHPASAMARVDGMTFVSSILPWDQPGTFRLLTLERQLGRDNREVRLDVCCSGVLEANKGDGQAVQHGGRARLDCSLVRLLKL